MPKRYPLVLSVGWFFAILFFIPAPFAHAYIDPGSGSYIFQILIGAVFGAIYFFKDFFVRGFHFVKNIFKRRKKND